MSPNRWLAVLLWPILLSCLAVWALIGLQKTEWYQQRLFHQLQAGDHDKRLAAAMGLARAGAEALLLEGIRSDEEPVRDAAQRALEQLWFVAAGSKAYQWTEDAHQAQAHERYAEALEILNRLVDQYPHYAEGWNRRASLYWQIGEYQKSMEDCRHTLELNPQHYGAWQGLGVCQLQLGDVAAACQSLRAALHILPHDEATKRSLRKCEDLLRYYPSTRGSEILQQNL